MAVVLVLPLPRPLERALHRARALARRAAAAWAAAEEVAERRALLAAPWHEEVLHWAHDGERWQLHGHRTPPRGWRGRSTTRSGWCPGAARRRPRAAEPSGPAEPSGAPAGEG